MAEYSEYGVVDDENSKDCPKETVCIDAYRVYDSCGDKNCLQDLQAYFTKTDQAVIDQANNVRIKGAVNKAPELINVAEENIKGLSYAEV